MVTITVSRLKVKLLKVAFKGGYHLVAGGRLLLEDRDGVKTPYPELPEYEPGRFPVPFTEWIDGKHPAVSVRTVRAKSSRPCGVVRAGVLLFTPLGRAAIRAALEAAR